MIHKSKKYGFYWHQDEDTDGRTVDELDRAFPMYYGDEDSCLARLSTSCAHKCLRETGHTGPHSDGGQALWGKTKLLKRELKALLMAARLGVKL